VVRSYPELNNLREGSHEATEVEVVAAQRSASAARRQASTALPGGKALKRIPAWKIAASPASRLHAVLGGLIVSVPKCA
jgi:hypothetical protein